MGDVRTCGRCRDGYLPFATGRQPAGRGVPPGHWVMFNMCSYCVLETRAKPSDLWGWTFDPDPHIPETRTLT